MYKASGACNKYAPEASGACSKYAPGAVCIQNMLQEHIGRIISLLINAPGAYATYNITQIILCSKSVLLEQALLQHHFEPKSHRTLPLSMNKQVAEFLVSEFCGFNPKFSLYPKFSSF